MSRTCRPRLRWRTSSITVGSGFSGSSGVASKTVRPTIMLMISWVEASVVLTVSM